jgi:hypothetical protein
MLHGVFFFSTSLSLSITTFITLLATVYKRSLAFLSLFSCVAVVATALLRLLHPAHPTMPIWDPFVPAERSIQRGLSRLPLALSHWLGYRPKSSPPSRTWIVCLWGFIGAFCGLSVILAIFGHTDYFRSRAVPPIVASFVSHLDHQGTYCYGV